MLQWWTPIYWMLIFHPNRWVSVISLIFLPFMLDEIILKPELMQADGLHPNEKAQVIISKNLWQFLEPVLSD